MARTNKAENQNKKHLKLQDNPPFALVESFRNLSTNIGFSVPKKGDGRGRVICISSAIPGEGKTTVSVNLAISCSGAGERVALVDCDLRKPSIHRFFNCEGTSTLVDYLSGEANMEKIVAKQVSPNLDVICGRKPAPNPLLLIKNERFQSLITALEKEYDYVLIDTPPLGLVSDALEVAKSTDGIILVTRQMVSKTPVIRQTVSDIEFSGVDFLGFVLNDYRGKNDSNGYYGKYKYGYKSHY